MSDVKRYDCYGKDALGYDYPALSREAIDGDWVLAEDHIAECDALRARLADIQGILDEAQKIVTACLDDKARLAEAERENERLRKELRHPKGCTYDSEGKPLTICHELATLRSEADRVHKEHAEMIDGYEAKLEEYERRIEELTEALELNHKDKHWIEGYRQGATDGAGEKP